MWNQQLTTAIAAAREAGNVIRKWYDGAVTVTEKGHDNPLTEADTEADRVLRETLLGAYPDYGWLSEETKDSPDRLQRRRVWIVDPLDGTKEFIQHIPEFCVCIGLVEDGQPVLGVSYNPATDEMFAGAVGTPVLLNDAPVHVTPLADLPQARVLASRSEVKRGEWSEFEQDFRVELTGSVAFKFALIAAGRADATFSLTPKNEWDICAGTALVNLAGGKVTDRYGQPLTFNRPNPKLPGLIASNANLYDPIVTLLKQRGKMEK